MPAAREHRHAERRPSQPRPAAAPTQATLQRAPDDGRARLERRTVAGVILLGLAIWIAVVFAGAMSQARSLEGQAAAARQDNEALRQKVAAGEQEIRFVQTAPFLSLQARAFGMGLVGEHLFGLAPGAPSPAPITPLGSDAPPEPPGTLVDDLVSIVFGR